jgi:hemolysin activation/secretion protein
MAVSKLLVKARKLATWPALILLASICQGTFAPPVTAQNFERYRPQIPEEGQPPTPDFPEPAEPGGDTTELIPELKGLVFVASPDNVETGGVDQPGIHVDPALSELQSRAFEARMQKYLGAPVSIRRLNELSRDVVLFYRSLGLLAVDVSVPEQRITTGTVQVVVIEGRVGEVRVEDACYFDNWVLLNQLCIAPGDAVYESVLLDELEWLSRNPFRDIELELAAGADPGETDVIFHVDDRWPWRFYMGYDDTGTRFTGLERGFIGFSWANALNRDHMMGYQFTGSSDTKKLNAHAGVYEIPLANRDILQFYGSYAEVSSDFVQPFTQDGVAWQAALRYRRELCDWGCLQHHVLGGFDFKQTNTNLEFGGDQVFASSADIIQFLAGYRGNWTDGWYSLYLAADVVYGPSGLSGNNTDPAYQTIRTGAKADYVYGRAIVEGVAPVNSWLDFVARITGQLAGENLLPSEQLGFGGFDSIRGYDMRLVNGDSGYFLNLEARTIPFCLGPYGGETQFLAFFDYGNADNHTLLPGEDVSVDLSSVGLGLRYALDDTASLRFDYGVQLNAVTFQPQPRQRIHLGVVLAY